jgi:hypothetical protein
MKNNLPYVVFFSLLLFASSTAYAQSISRDVTSSAGGTLVNSDASVTFIVGEVVGEVFSNSSTISYISVGFIQPDVEVKELLDRVLQDLIVYPNPTRNGLVKLSFNNIPEGNYTVEIFDVLGRMHQSQFVNFLKENFLYVDLNVSSLPKGMYYIKVHSNNFQGQVKLIKL